MRYYASGETRLSTGNMFTDRLFTGQRQMAGLRIYQFGARFYSPELGRFLSADPMGQNLAVPQAFNRYSYALNNPVRYTDPTGYYCVEDDVNGVPVRADCWTGDYSTSSSSTTTTTQSSGGGGGEDGGSDGSGGNALVLPRPISSALDEVNTINSELEPPNPSVGALVAIGVLLTGAIVVSEIGLVWAEVSIAPAAAANPLVGVPLELVLVGASLALIDLDVAYWSYTYRVMENPDVKQDFEILPPWGL